MFTAKFKRNVNLVIKETPIPSLVLNPQSNNHLAKLRFLIYTTWQMTEVNILANFFFYLFFWNNNEKDGAKKSSLLNSLRQASQRA